MPSGFTQNLRSLKKRSLLGQLVVGLLSLELLFFASFISLSVPVPTARNMEAYYRNTARSILLQIGTLKPVIKETIEAKFPLVSETAKEVRTSTYVPLLPLAVALGYVLGSPLAVIVSSLYLILGLQGPQEGLYLFASGGGINYTKEVGFGYLVGIICGAWFSAWISPDDERKSWRQLLAAVGGVSIVHLIGLACVFGSSIAVLLFEGEQAYLHFQPWLSEQIRNLSWYTLPYDLLFATMLIALLFPLRSLFSMLTRPDIAHKGKPTVEAQLEVLQESTV